MRPDNAAPQLATAQSGRNEAAKEEGEARTPRAPAKGYVPGPPDPVPSALPLQLDLATALHV